MSSPPSVVVPTPRTSGSNEHVAFRRALRRVAPTIARPLPWIGDQRPWAVLVSEVMLQQTPTSRVIEPWTRFLEHFATPRACADAPLSEVLALWQGLGYPRRAKALHDTARMIRDNFGGVVPRVPAELRTLPGVGEYTAAAVASFAYGERVAVLDTNVGRVLARALANERLSPNGARALAQALLPRDNVAAFNQAMLDLGAQFCRSTPRCASCPIATRCRWHVEGGDDPAPRSAGVSRPQAPYEGSNRQLRGRVLRALREGPRPRRALEMVLSGVASTRRDDVLASLLRDGLVVVRGEEFSLAGAPEASVRDAPLTSTTLMAGGGDR